MKLQQSNFDQFADSWWDKNGSMKILHSMHETRMLFIKERIKNRFNNFKDFKSIMKKKTILDLGCGGGLLSEDLSSYGANIIAVDSSKELIKIAKERAFKNKIKIDYRNTTIQKLAEKKIKFDIIISLEVIEHVKDYRIFLNNIFKCLNTNGILILSTINRTLFSYLSTILIAEKIFKLVPDSIHDWNLYLKPKEIIEHCQKSKMQLDKLSGLFPIPSIKGIQWIRTKSSKSNYILSIIN